LIALKVVPLNKAMSDNRAGIRQPLKALLEFPQERTFAGIVRADDGCDRIGNSDMFACCQSDIFELHAPAFI